ncbi:hypothetical protein BU24DRAFT_473809 [Aaosphaeria arxii CBS 175.79]|uniref:Uncharacterized protein n=1 Tax=Aaosphaeria arxii CBS 175.79 TaxID=1450172 RepID=A0A6A5X9U3_9PLEO|nr:uncharacterized protein BU24DRAFT_473809 [Aaosphaeria arxii CBS 175.79]KAF2009636.1 hypothetical protein BU24DRAFT_473809 [Aaosphaeria arxii CBS 175.79]
MVLEFLVKISNPPNNVLGTIVFLAYIAAALVLTSHIVLSLYKQHQRHPPRSRHGTTVLVAFSIVSFATLSYHMSRYLLSSYLNWSLTQSFFRPHDSRSVWAWMLNSHLFTSFAKELLRDEPSRKVTQIALLETWGWNVWMARNGTPIPSPPPPKSIQYKTPPFPIAASLYILTSPPSPQKASYHSLQTRTLLPYIALGQILPITFTTSLFALRLSFLPTPSPKSSPPPTNSSIRSSILHIPLLLLTLLFQSLSFFLPRFRRSNFFTGLVLVTRVFLLLPYAPRLLSTTRRRPSTAGAGGYVTVAAVVALKLAGAVREVGGSEIGRVMTGEGGWSVKALGWDAVVGVGVAVWLCVRGGV